MPESDHPRFPDHLTNPTDPCDPVDTTVLPAGQQWPSDPLTDLEHDREVLSWLQCSPQLSNDVKGYLVDALLDWALTGRGYPQMALPDAGPDCDHLQALQQIIELIPQRIAQAQTVADKLPGAGVVAERSTAGSVGGCWRSRGRRGRRGNRDDGLAVPATLARAT